METVELELNSKEESVSIDENTVFDVLEEIDEPRGIKYGDQLSVQDIVEQPDGIHIIFTEIDHYIQKYAVEGLLDDGIIKIS